MKSRPNILLITTDTQRWDTLACMGSPHAISPNLDRLAREGVLFRNAHTSSPVCMPARCSLMTGTHAHVHGCIENGFGRFDHLPMLPDLLKEKGYYNIMVGKTHFGPIPDSFDVSFCTKGEKNSEADDFYASFIRSKGYSRQTKHFEKNPVPEDIFIDAFLVTTTIEEIHKASQTPDRPFFAFCSLLSPHGPIDPPGQWASLYNDVPLPEVNYQEGEISTHPPALRSLLGYPDRPDVNGEDLLRQRQLYYGLASYCDHQVGRLMKFLDDSGLREDTLVIFTSDHGQQYMDHGFNDKHNWYDETWRVPLIMSQPSCLPCGQSEDFAMLHDLTVSILAAAGTACPSMQGYDLYTPLAASEQLPRCCASASLFRSAALATMRWKMEYYFEDGCGRLFDRIRDPEEQFDLWDEPALSSVRNRLLLALLGWHGDTIDLKGLVQRSHVGGPIAKRAVAHIRAASGLASERRLNELCKEIDGMTTSAKSTTSNKPDADDGK